MSDIWRIRHLLLSRDFNTGKLWASYYRIAGWDNPGGMGGLTGRIIPEPLSEEDKALIGDTPIPPVLAKVDL